MTNFRLAYNNFAADDAAVLSASSELFLFPISYAVDSFRSKKWKPSGAFRITSANNKIYINDGSNKEATISSAVYTTGALLAANIQSALNAVSTLWTCTYSTSTGLFTIARSSGTKVLRLTQLTNAAWDTLGFVGSIDQNAAEADARRNHTSERVKIDFGVAREVKFIAVYQSPDSQFCISDTATISIRANSVDNYDSPAFSTTGTVTVDGIYIFLPASTNTSYRYWYFDFIDRENTVGPEGFSLKLWLGDYIEPVSRNIINGFSVSVVDPSVVTVANNGVRYFNRKTKYKRFQNAGIEWVEDSDREMIVAAYEYCGRSRPCFISLDPSALISSAVNEFTKLVTFDDDPQMNHQKYNFYGFSFNFSEVVG